MKIKQIVEVNASSRFFGPNFFECSVFGPKWRGIFWGHSLHELKWETNVRYNSCITYLWFVHLNMSSTFDFSVVKSSREELKLYTLNCSNSCGSWITVAITSTLRYISAKSVLSVYTLFNKIILHATVMAQRSAKVQYMVKKWPNGYLKVSR